MSAERELSRSVGMPVVAACILATLLTVCLAQTVGPQLASPPIDSTWYRAMAAGGQAAKPFANRVLAPWIAGRVAALFGTSTDTGFYVLGLASVWIALCGVALPLLRRRQALGLTAGTLLLFFWRDSFGNYFLPDLPHMALLVVFFTLLRVRAWRAAAVMLVPLYLARESTLLLSLVAVPVLWRLLGRGTGMLFLAGSVAGVAASKFASRHALPNIHHLDDTLYLLAKVPWNFSRNVLGLGLWADTFAEDPPPTHVWRVPAGLHLGAIHAVGYYPPNVHAPLYLLMIMLLLFGLGPCVAFCLLRRFSWVRLFPRDEPYLWVTAIYGMMAYLLAPSLGASLFRLVEYGWPVFLIYIPAIMPRVWPRWKPGWALCLLAAHLLPAWLILSGWVRGPVLPFVAVLTANALGLVLLMRAPAAATEAS